MGDQVSVVLEITLESLDFLLVDDVQPIAQGTQEVLVVTDNDESALEIVQSHNERVNSVEIQMIGWLIKHENMRLLPCDHGEGDTTLLTTREEVHWSKSKIATDTKATQMGTELVRMHIRILLHHLLNRRETQIEQIHVMLSEHSDSQPVMDESVAVL